MGALASPSTRQQQNRCCGTTHPLVGGDALRVVRNIVLLSLLVYVAGFNVRYFVTSVADTRQRGAGAKMLDLLYWPLLKLFGPGAYEGKMRRLEPRLEVIDRVVAYIALGALAVVWLAYLVSVITSLTAD